MFPFVARLGIHLFFIIIISFLLVLAMNPQLYTVFPQIDVSRLLSFKTLFISIMLEALPFILLGVLVSSFLHVFIPEHWMRKWIPRNPIFGIIFACLFGLIFPLCECGMVPVVRRFILKGMPPYIAVVFVLAGPILNPIVYAATYSAFRLHPSIAYARMGLAFVVAVFIGLFLYLFVKGNPLKISAPTLYEGGSAGLTEHVHEKDEKLSAFLDHATSEFFEMGKYLVFGAIMTGVVQTFLERGSLSGIAHNPWTSNLFMMGFAYVLALLQMRLLPLPSSVRFRPDRCSLFLFSGPCLISRVH